jgi:RHS repeat-associated protein
MKKIIFYLICFCPILFFGQTSTGVNISTEGTTWQVILVKEASLTLSGTGQLSVSGCPQSPDPRPNCRIDVTHYKPAMLDRYEAFQSANPTSYTFLYFLNVYLTSAERASYFDYKTSTNLSYPDLVKSNIPLNYNITQGIVLFEVVKACTFGGNSTTSASYASLNLTCQNRYYYDGDEDGFGNPNLVTSAFFCVKPVRFYVTNFDDCDDSTASIGKKKTWYIDHDGDGYGSGSYYSAILPPGVLRTIESCLKPSANLGYSYADNYLDYDDENASNIPSNVIIYYPDNDGDGYGFVQGPSVPGYVAPAGYVANNLDCNDSDSGVVAILWGIDVNSDGVINDLDGSIKSQCTSPGSTYSLVNDPNNNWTHGVSYDLKGNITGIARTYFDDLGKPNVSLSKNMVQNRVWGTETSYDNFGRNDKTSFVAPAAVNSFEKSNFLTAAGTVSPYPLTITQTTPITTSIDLQAINTLTASSVINTGLTVNFKANEITLSPGFTATSGTSFTAVPVPVPNMTTSATVTNYYSDSNTIETFQATATHPYVQVNYDTLNPGNTINVVGGNKIDNLWKTGYAFTTPAAQEMYYVYGYNYYDGAIANGKEEVITKFYKSVGVDANGVENVAFSDGEGKTLASARSGGATSYPVYSLIGTQGFIDVHIPSGAPAGTLLGSATYYKVYDLKTGLQISPTPATLPSGNAYRIEAIVIPTVDPKVYIAQTPTGGAITTDAGAKGLSYSVNYYDFSVNVYNKTGQLIKSVQPNGYELNAVIKDVPLHMQPTATAFISTYTYNDQGQLKQATSPDEGTSKFLYRQDGQIRYSQSAKQADKKVSYTDYDTYGRPVESGVITSVAGIWAFASVNPDAALIAGTRSEQTFTIYDDVDNNTTTVALPTTPTNLTLAGVLTTAGIPTTNYVQNNLSGNVAVTFTKTGATINAITWYSYDIYGRSEWMVQYNEGLGAKTIHYEYDYKGNVKKVLFQKNKSAELFVHQYTYDANSVLTKVETSTDNTSFITHADYTYYATGELKRVNIAQGAQGIDYVYTLGGQLKSINHPSLEQSKDPGGDANDVFGVTLDYYSGDYLRTGRNIASSPTIAGANQDFNGNIKAARWGNKGIPGDYTNGTASQKAYNYNYNRNNWLTEATFGTTDNTGVITGVNKYKEGALSYDANGNIKTLQRTNDTGATTDNLTYNYTGRNQLNSVADAVTTPTGPTDIEGQGANNYTYNAIGQMTSNVQENLFYFYNTQGLVTEVRKGANPVVKFYYNERGQRVKKESFNTASPYALTSTDYYSLDISGNTMAIYNQPSSGAIAQKELPLYGSSRLGVYNRTSVAANDYMMYQVTDHLGNVRAVIKKMVNNPVVGIIASYADYYPFGEQLPGRNSMADYRYAFQGQELDKETGMEAFQLRLWDGRIGRWLSPDPYGQYASPYLGMGNNPIGMVDPDGGFAEGPGKGLWGWFKGLFSSDTVDGGTLDEVKVSGTFKPRERSFYANIHDLFLPPSDMPFPEPMRQGVQNDPNHVTLIDIYKSGLGITTLQNFRDGIREKDLGKIQIGYTSIFLGATGFLNNSVERATVTSFESLAANPTKIWGKSADEVAVILGEGWERASLNSGDGWKFMQTKGDGFISFTTGNSHHPNSTYYKINGGIIGKNKVVGSGYVPTSNDKSKIHYIRY